MSVRARRPPSPPRPPAGPLPAAAQPRYPYAKEEHLDADARREAASRGLRPGRSSNAPGGLDLAPAEWKLLVVIVLFAAGVRLWRISKPASVVFDEVHFGKFASKYIKTQYFVDVHPPLAKLLITLAAFVFGYDGNFDFKDIGKPYEHVPYTAMRLVPGLLGVATIPIAYLTLRALACRATTALLAALLLTLDNALVTQSRHILLDAPLVFFTALSALAWAGFANEDRKRDGPFSEGWWTWLALTGLSLGAVVSCKWVGLFTIATVGLCTVGQLWALLGDLRVPPRLFARHLAARALCLIALPVAFYMAMFAIHFAILNGSGDGDGFMSAEFQHTLGGRGMADTFADVAVGSEVSIRHVNTQGGYLHSHAHNYPGGSKQQQITLYPHRDTNNVWRVLNASENAPEVDWRAHPLEYLTPGLRIKLRHVETDKALHSHDFRPPVSDVDFQNEVSAYGMAGFLGDANDDWVVEIDSVTGGDRHGKSRVRTLRTQFRLRHALTGCYLFSHKVKLPDWGWEQQEVTCNKNAVRANSLWFIETSEHEMFPADAEKVNYRLPGFFAKFWELQQVMWTTNAGLTDRHTYDSRPDAWPRLRRGINFWVKDHRQIYLLGNPWVWTLSSAAVGAYVALRGLLVLRAKRGYRDFENTHVVKYDALCGFLFLGWALHYLPFFLMGRQLFLHHYLPALYFGVLLAAAAFDGATAHLRPRARLQLAGAVVLVAAWAFWHWAPLAYGSPWTRAQCERARWVKTWDFSCNDFLTDYAQYSVHAPATPVTTAVPVATVGADGGRAPVVVDEPVPVAVPVPAEEHTTSVGFGQAEPGRDIFAGQPARDVRSEPGAAAVEEQAPAREGGAEKVVSAAFQAEKTPVSAPAEVPAPEKANAEVKLETPPAQVKTPEPEAVKAPSPAGPLDEVAAEADRVAKDLYPEAHAQN